MSDEMSYEGIDEADLVLALYRGTRAIGRGVFHDRGDLTVEEVRTDLSAMVQQQPMAIPQQIPGGLGNLVGQRIHLDYYRGRPLKVSLDTERKVVCGARLYDRDAGEGACQRVIESLR